MRKVVLFLFIFLLLSLALWATSSWYLGTKTQKYIINFTENIKQNPDALFTLDLLNYDKSVFKAKVSVRLNINPAHNISRLYEGAVDGLNTYNFNIDITHGPLFINANGISKGRSVWKFGLDDINQTVNAQTTIDQALDDLEVLINFENILVYKLPFELPLQQFLGSNLLLSGFYDLKTSSHEGKVESNELKFIDENHSIVATDIKLQFQQKDIIKNESMKFNVSGVSPSIRYSFSLFPEEVVLNANYVGHYSLIKDKLNIYNQLLFNMINKDSQYPIEKGDLRLKINELSFDALRGLSVELSQVKNLQEQVQWVLEEQGELPEGQDKIWELQDQEIRYFQKLPSLVSKVIFSNEESDVQSVNDASIRFYLKTEYNNEHSIVNGALYPTDIDVSELDTSVLSLSSLVHPYAEISINNDWLMYLSSRFPIAKNNFTLSYKNKQLLMQ